MKVSYKTSPPEYFAHLVLSRVSLTHPIDLEKVAIALGLRIRTVAMNAWDGVMQKVSDGRALGTIRIRAGIGSHGRKRFTIAHEIGHYLLPGHGEEYSSCTFSDINVPRKSALKELEANRFAAELLLPADQIPSRIGDQPLSIDIIRRVAKEFEASLLATAFQCVAATSENCVVIVTLDRIVQYYRPSKSWGCAIEVSCPLSDRSLAYRLNLTNKEATGTVHICAWAHSGWFDVLDQVRENSLYVPEHNMILTILSYLRPQNIMNERGLDLIMNSTEVDYSVR